MNFGIGGNVRMLEIKLVVLIGHLIFGVQLVKLTNSIQFEQFEHKLVV